MRKSDFVIIPDSEVVISRREYHIGFKWENTIFQLDKDGLFMPTPTLFLTHYVNVTNSYDGKSKMYDGNGRELDRGEVKKIYDDINNCFVHLDTRFEKNDGIFYIYNTHRIIGDNLVPRYTYKLEECIMPMQDGYVSPKFNNQGLPTEKKERQGPYGNILFKYPIGGSVACFYRVGDGVCFDYNMDSSENPFIGVFPCIEDVQKISTKF